MLIAVFPCSFKPLSIWVILYSKPKAIVILKVSIIDLSIRPEVLSLTMLLAHEPLALIDPAIWPVEKPIAIHLVLNKLALVKLTLAGDSSANAMAAPIVEEALIER